MLEGEAARIREILFEAGPVSPLLNVGSSTGAFRAMENPHIEAALFGPLRARGVEIGHCDLEQGDGAPFALLAPLRRRSFLSRAHRWLWYARPQLLALR